MGTKVVLDTNVLISALGWKGPSRTIFNWILEKKYELLLSKGHLREIEKVLQYPRLGFSSMEREAFLSILLETATVVRVGEAIRAVKRDPDDNIILSAAVSGKARYLVSGDQDLLALGTYRGIQIVSPSEFLRREKISQT